MRTKPYPSDLTDAQWVFLKPLLPPASNLGRPRKTEVRDVVDAILCRNRNGCTWRPLLHDFPTWRTVYNDFIKWTADGTWQAIHDALRERGRVKASREPTPSAGSIDSQTVTERSAKRSGIEWTDIGLKNRLNSKRLRVRGRGSVFRVILHIVAGWNVLRAAAPTKMRMWVTGQVARTLKSREIVPADGLCALVLRLWKSFQAVWGILSVVPIVLRALTLLERKSPTLNLNISANPST